MYGHVIMVLVCLQFLGIFIFHHRVCFDRDINNDMLFMSLVLKTMVNGHILISESVSFVVN